MDFNRQGRRLSSNAQLLLMSVHEQERPKFDTAMLDNIALSKPDNDVPLLEEKRGRGRPRKNTIEQQIKPANDVPLLQEKRGRGRPRKTVELEIKTKLKENHIVDINEKLKLLETITNGYKEIQRLDKETQKNVERLCAMIHNSK